VVLTVACMAKKYNAAEYQRWYRKHRADKVKASTERTKAKRKERLDRLSAIKRASGCVTCGEQDPICLDFHHRNPSEKIDSISKMANTKVAWSIIETELAKCSVICANCHRKLHRASLVE